MLIKLAIIDSGHVVLCPEIFKRIAAINEHVKYNHLLNCLEAEIPDIFVLSNDTITIPQTSLTNEQV